MNYWRLRHERKTTYSFMRGEGVVMTMHLSDWERDQVQDLMAVANRGAQAASPVPSGLDAVRKIVSVSSYDVTLRAKKECSDVDWCDGYLHGAMAFLEPIWEIVGVEGDSFVPGPDATGGAMAHAKDLLHEIDKVGVPIEDIREWLAEIIARLEYDALASPEVAEKHDKGLGCCYRPGLTAPCDCKCHLVVAEKPKSPDDRCAHRFTDSKRICGLPHADQIHRTGTGWCFHDFVEPVAPEPIEKWSDPCYYSFPGSSYRCLWRREEHRPGGPTPHPFVEKPVAPEIELKCARCGEMYSRFIGCDLIPHCEPVAPEGGEQSEERRCLFCGGVGHDPQDCATPCDYDSPTVRDSAPVAITDEIKERVMGSDYDKPALYKRALKECAILSNPTTALELYALMLESAMALTTPPASAPEPIFAYYHGCDSNYPADDFVHDCKAAPAAVGDSAPVCVGYLNERLAPILKDVAVLMRDRELRGGP